MMAFKQETHVEIVKRIDEIEAEMYGLYRRLERLRLDLQAMWRVLPSGKHWNSAKHADSAHSSKVASPSVEGGEK